MSCFNERFNCSKQIIGIHSIPVFTVIFSENPELDCPFCTLPKARVLDANSTGIVIRDGFPISPGHTLVIPRAHVGSLFEITHQQFSDLHELLHRAKESLQAEFAPDGYNIGINDGAAAGQTVPHLHIHLIPRYAGDQPDPRGGVRWIFPDKANYWSK